jgi:hypothetical protein
MNVHPQQDLGLISMLTIELAEGTEHSKPSSFRSWSKDKHHDEDLS